MELSKQFVGNIQKRAPTLSSSEVMTTTILLHDKGYRYSKDFFIRYVQKHLTQMFQKQFPPTENENLHCACHILFIFLIFDINNF